MKTDLVIIEEVKRGKVDAFGELVMRHRQVLLRLAMRMTRDLELAEDIVQESFLKAYRKLNSFEGRSSFKSWLYQITINTTKNKLRARRHDLVCIDHVSLAVASGVEGFIQHQNVKDVLQDEIETLPTKQKMALNLRIFEDLSFKEIAEIMECPYDTAKANYRHALMKLRHRFEESKELRKLRGLKLNSSAEIKTGAVEVKSK